MSVCKILLSLALIGLPIAGYTQCTGTYQTGILNPGNWGDGLNWSGGCVLYPGAVSGDNDTADLTGATPTTVTLIDVSSDPIQVYLENLNISGASYTINPDNLSAPVSNLIFESPTGSIFVASGGLLIQAPVQLGVTAPMTVSVASGVLLTMNGTVTDMGSTTLIYDGPGVFIVDNTNVNNPNLTFTLNGTASLPSGTGALDIEGGEFQVVNGQDISSGDGTTFITTNAAGNVIINGGENGLLLVTNFFTVSGTANTGASLLLESSPASITLQSGFLVAQNEGDVNSSGQGVGVYIGAENLNISSGHVVVTNSGTIAGPNIGAQVYFSDMVNQTGGIIEIQTTGSAQAGVGANFSAPFITTSTGGVFSNGETTYAGEFTVGSGGIIVGDGVFSSGVFEMPLTYINGGTIFPGVPDDLTDVTPVNTPAVLTVQGMYQQTSGGILSVTVANSTAGGVPGPTTFSQLAITDRGDMSGGTAMLSGSVQVALAPNYVINNGDTIPILNALYGITGTFNPAIINYNLPPNMQVVISYSADPSVLLTFIIPGSPITVPTMPAMHQSIFASVNHTHTRIARELQNLRYRFCIKKVAACTPKPPPCAKPKPKPCAKPKPKACDKPKPRSCAKPTPKSCDKPKPKACDQPKPKSCDKPKPKACDQPKPKSCDKPKPKACDQPKPKSCDKPQPRCSKVATSEGTAPVQTISTPLASTQGTLAFLSWNKQQEANECCERQQDCCAEHRHWNVYFGPIGTVGGVHTKETQPGYEETSVGGLAGIDYAFSHGGLGFMADYENINGRVHHHWGKFDISQAHFSLYSTYAAHRLSFDAIVGGGYDWFNVHRRTPTGTTRGKTRAREFDALFGLAYNAVGSQECCSPARFQITPMSNLQYIYLDTSGYKEHSDVPNDFKIHGQVNKSLRSTLGTWMSYGWTGNNISFTPELYLAWQREYLDHTHSLYVTPLDVVGPTSKLKVRGAGRNTFQAGLDLMFRLYDFYGIEASYDFEWNSLFHDQAFYLGFNIEF